MFHSSIPQPNYLPRNMHNFSRERTSSDPNARTQNHPRVHQLAQSNQTRPRSLQNVNRIIPSAVVHPSQLHSFQTNSQPSIMDSPPSYEEAINMPKRIV